MDYSQKSYGRNAEVADIFRQFNAGFDISMPGPRRLGKTFVLDRLVDAGPLNGWKAIKIEVAGCADTNALFRKISLKIADQMHAAKRSVHWLRQRAGQVTNPRTTSSGNWYQQPLSLDHETNFGRHIKEMNKSKKHQWALLVDELPIFLKALHDQGEQGVATARDFMNHLSALSVDYPKVRWLITGSIGLEPLAQAGNYMGVLAKFRPFTLDTLTHEQARDFVIDSASIGKLMYRQKISTVEANAIINATGWRAAFYLDAVANQLRGALTEDAEQANALVEEAVKKLLSPIGSSTFGVWEEHLRKHYSSNDRSNAIVILNALSQHSLGLSLNSLLTTIASPKMTAENLRQLLWRLDAEGFVNVDNWDSTDSITSFRNILLRRWWLRFPPSTT